MSHLSTARGRLVDAILVGLVIFDLGVAAGAFAFPDLWSRVLHGTEYVDPAGLLRRTGSIWIAFTVVQVVALLRWRSHPHWLLMVSGIRLSEMFADWTYLAFADSVTPFGTVALTLTLPINLAICWFLFRNSLVTMRVAGEKQPTDPSPAAAG